MNISNASVGVTGNDLMSIYNDFINIKEIDIENIEISDEIRIVGEFKKGIIVKFQVGLKIRSIDKNTISAEVSTFKILSLSVAKFIRKMALKIALKSLKDKGIIYSNGVVKINYKYLMKDIPYIDFDINNIEIENGVFMVEASEVKVSLGGELKKDVEIFSVDEEKEKEVEVILSEVNKVEDVYTKGRSKMKKKLPTKIQKYGDYVFVLPDIVALIYRLLKDKRVSIKTKIVIAGAVSYIAVPTDMIPDKIPFIGKIDDIAIAVFALNTVVNEVPLNIVLDNWQGKNDIILVLKSVVEYATNFTGAKNIETICNVIEDLVTV